MIATQTNNPKSTAHAQVNQPVAGNASASDQSFSEQAQNTAARLIEQASELVIQRPGTCLAVSFILGGAVAWLISKRN